MAENSTHGHRPADTLVESGPRAAAPSSPRDGSEAPVFRERGGLTEAARRGDGLQAPVRGRELVAVLLLVVLADLTIYRGEGFAGYAALFVAAPLLLLVGAPRLRVRAALGVSGVMMLILAARLVWCGSGLLVGAGFVLLVAFAMALAGLRPYVLDVVAYGCQTVVAGWAGLAHYRRSAERSSLLPRVAWLKIGLPLAAVLGFGTLFVLANPDVATAFAEGLERALTSIWEGLLRLGPTRQQVLLWIAAAWIAVGLLRPVVRRSVLARLSGEGREIDETPETADAPAETPLYGALRNTLVAVIVLFAAYLVFEFKTLWFRVFPEGFYYSGYAHEGAAWLTVALASATLVLSAIFRGRVLGDPRLPRLRRLAWIWSAESILLALAVYNRLFIYVGFNGMTRMRTVGLFGISAVIVGFGLVVWKIIYGRDFVWLVRRQLWTLAIAVYLFAVTPVDMIVHTYNVRRILAGDPAPSVQISVHPIDSAGVLVLHPLVDSEDRVIREGVRALLAERALRAELLAREREEQGWTSIQLADRVLLENLRGVRSDWEKYADPARRAAALARFHAYAYQWY